MTLTPHSSWQLGQFCSYTSSARQHGQQQQLAAQCLACHISKSAAGAAKANAERAKVCFSVGYTACAYYHSNARKSVQWLQLQHRQDLSCTDLFFQEPNRVVVIILVLLTVPCLLLNQ